MVETSDLIIQLRTRLDAISTRSELEAVKIAYMGRNGLVNELFSQLKNIPPEEKKEKGKELNALKHSIEEILEHKEQHILSHLEKEIQVDITLPGQRYIKGSLHLVTHAIDEISSIFQKLGFIRVSYPEIDWESNAFDALNMPPDHPARDDFETFFIDAKPHPEFGKMVLTPHTSNGQTREMKRLGKPPIRMINIGKTYRPNWDTTHTPMFHQFEGLCVDKNITISHLKGTIDFFAKQFFGEDRETRIRPFHFQFTEPSFEVDITCDVCKGTGLVNGDKCRVCKQGWLELGGAGMVHPNVLKAGGIDSQEYTGWAFGFGVERVVMMKENMNLNDLRIMYNGDIRFLEQF